MFNLKKNFTTTVLVLFLLNLSACTANNETKKSDRSLKVSACSSETSGLGINPFNEQNNTKEETVFINDPRELKGPGHAQIDNENVLAIAESPVSSLPVLVESCDGVETVVTDISRIVTLDLYGTLTETVFALGLGKNVVGKDRSANFPESQNVTVVTPSGHDINAEAILALNPTVILTDETIGPRAVQKQLRDSGIPVIFFDKKRNMAGIPAQVKAVSEVLGVPEVGAKLSQNIIDEVKQASIVIPENQTPLRIAFLYVRGSAGIYLMAGPGSGADSLIEAIGAKDIGTEIGLKQPFTPITSESLIQANPDVILVMSEGLKSAGGVESLTKIAGISETNAGKNQRIVDMEDTLLLSFGSRIAKIVTALAHAVYRE